MGIQFVPPNQSIALLFGHISTPVTYGVTCGGEEAQVLERSGAGLEGRGLMEFTFKKEEEEEGVS